MGQCCHVGGSQRGALFLFVRRGAQVPGQQACGPPTAAETEHASLCLVCEVRNVRAG